MKTKLLLVSIAITCGFTNASLAMTKVEYKTQKDMISGDYKVNRDKCGSLKANAKDICVSEAKGVEKIAKAELESTYTPSARQSEIVAMAIADAAYSTAKEKCDDSQGNAKTICRADAKSVYVKAKDEARVIRMNAETGKLNTSVRNMATKDENDAAFKAAVVRCDSMLGASKDACITDAKLKYDVK